MAQTVRPLNQHDAITRLVPPQFFQPGGTVQPPQIEMMNRAQAGFVFLDQGEGRAGHLQRRIAGGGAQEGARERALAGPQWPFQQHGIADPREPSQRGGKRLRRRQVRQRDQPRGGGDDHDPTSVPQRGSRRQRLAARCLSAAGL
jgi:hypothetical protein